MQPTNWGALPFGKHLPQAVYLHRELVPRLPIVVQSSINRVVSLAGLAPERYDVVKLGSDGKRISLLSYPGFWTDGFPTLAESWVVIDPSEPRVRYLDYRGHWNPPVLHRKELLLATDHPARDGFSVLTAAAEECGLFEDTSSIGQLLQWKETLRAKGRRVVGNALEVGAETLDSVNEPVLRHRTALRRSGLSTPMQALLRHGFLEGSHTVFDYGCGRGDDLATLEEMGLRATGWDPYFHPGGTRAAADVVNLGFVLNVIEDLAERRAALENAFGLTKRLLVIGVLIGGRTAYEKYRLFRDGVLTGRGTFQKYYTPDELHEYLEEVCGRQPISVGPGLAFVFRSDDDEQSFLSDRQRSPVFRVAPSRPPREPSPPRIRTRAPSKWALHQPLLDMFYVACTDFGRLPESGEWNRYDEIRVLGAPKTVLRRLLAERGDEEFLRGRQRCMDDLLVYLSLNMFERRRSFGLLPPRLQADVRAFWGAYTKAAEDARQLLFSLGSSDTLVMASRLAAAQGLGYLGPRDELFFLTSQLSRLPRELRVFVGCATRLHGEVDDADLVKVHSRTGKLTVHLYDDFDGAVLPALLERVKIDLRRQTLLFVDYAARERQQLLYYKSRYQVADDPRREQQQAFDEALGALPFLDLSGFGPARQDLLAALHAHGWEIDGHELRRAT